MSYFKKLKEITIKEFFDDDSIINLKNEVVDGNILILRSAFNSENLRKIFINIKNSNIDTTKDTRMLEGIKNIHYRSDSTGAGSYSAKDLSWYFFPWNKDATGLSDLIEPFFNQIIKMNGYNTKTIKNNTPKDIVIQRIQIIYYPIGSGNISLHQDPTNITKVTCGIYITENGLDYNKGGFYVYDMNKKKINIDENIKSGDLILFYNGLFHGVDIVSKNKNNNSKINGRGFINLSLLESHESKNRKTTKGIRKI